MNPEFRLSMMSIDSFRERGYAKLKSVLSKEFLARYETEVTRSVLRFGEKARTLDERDTYGKAFLQLPNLWMRNELIKELVLCESLGRIASELLSVTGVRIYHDQALYKEPGGGHTPWHADEYYWPVEPGQAITAWIPFNPVPLEMGPLAFGMKSSSIGGGEEIRISDESEEAISRLMRSSNFRQDETPFDLGDVSFHSPVTYHRAGANHTDEYRKVFTIIYISEDARMTQLTSRAKEHDARSWCPGIEPGEIMASEINPLVYSSRR